MIIGTVMMSNSTQSQSTNQQQQQQQQQQSAIIQQHAQNYQNKMLNRGTAIQQFDAIIQQQTCQMSDTDMSEHGTIRSSVVSNRAITRVQRTTTTSANTNGQTNPVSTSSYDQQQQQQRYHHQQRHHRSSKHRQPSSITSSSHSSSSRHNSHSHRSVNFDHNKAIPEIANEQQQQEQQNIQVKDQFEQVDGGGGGGDGDMDGNDERIQVQILPQDDNWGENTTAYTGATSEVSDFNDDMTEDGRSRKDDNMIGGGGGGGIQIDYNGSTTHKSISLSKFCSRYLGYLCAVIVILCTYVTPIMFIILPRVNLFQNWYVSECGIECEGLLIGIAFKLFLLLLGIWALYLRKPKATLPRVYELRALIIFLLLILTFSYWLFYGVRILDTRQSDYYKILQFAVTYVDVLLFIYIIAVFILEIRHLQPQYVVKMIRSPDGEQFEYTCGKMSIQRAAVWLLEQYYKDFPVYNPWLENAQHRRRLNIQPSDLASIKSGKSSTFKYYNVDGNDDGQPVTVMQENEKEQKSKLILPSARMGMHHNDRFYEEYEYERRLRKRRARLVSATEDAFTHIKRISSSHSTSQSTNSQKEHVPQTIMDPLEAAQAIFTSIARDLRRYLRITRQQPYYTRDSIISHLADCVTYDMSPKSFLQRYLKSESIIFNHRALLSGSSGTFQLPPPPSSMQSSSTSKSKIVSNKFKTPEQSWILICDTVLYQNVEDNLMLVLKQNEITLMCTFKRLPHFNLIEDIIDPKRNKFVLKMNSETSV